VTGVHVGLEVAIVRTAKIIADESFDGRCIEIDGRASGPWNEADVVGLFTVGSARRASREENRCSVDAAV